MYGKPWKKRNSKETVGYSEWLIQSCFLSTESVETATFASHKQTQTPSSFHWKTYSFQGNIHLANVKDCLLLCYSSVPADRHMWQRACLQTQDVLNSPHRSGNLYVTLMLSTLFGTVFLHTASTPPKLETTSK